MEGAPLGAKDSGWGPAGGVPGRAGCVETQLGTTTTAFGS